MLPCSVSRRLQLSSQAATDSQASFHASVKQRLAAGRCSAISTSRPAVGRRLAIIRVPFRTVDHIRAADRVWQCLPDALKQGLQGIGCVLLRIAILRRAIHFVPAVARPLVVVCPPWHSTAIVARILQYAFNGRLMVGFLLWALLMCVSEELRVRSRYEPLMMLLLACCARCTALPSWSNSSGQVCSCCRLQGTRCSCPGVSFCGPLLST